MIINTRSSWLPGDYRGFRNRGHRAHSSGDYRHRPPPDEHKGLRIHNVQTCSPEVHLNAKMQAMIGRAIVSHFIASEHRVLAVAVAKLHAHALVELPDNIIRIRAIVGEAKRLSSRAVKSLRPGSIWSAGGTFKPITSRDHQQSVFKYILYSQGRGAWTWGFKDESGQGHFQRAHPLHDQPPRRGKA